MRIMVVSPVRMFRDSLAGVLGSMDPVPEVVAEVSVVALHHRSPGEQPDAVLVDVTRDIGMEEVALVAAKWRNLPLLALGPLERREEVVRHGHAGFVARDAKIQDSTVRHLGRCRRPHAVSGKDQRRAPWGPVQPRAAADVGARGPELDEAGGRGSADDWPRPRQ
jgi:two-component system nitrate/nitrite response regulator NarL